MGYASSRYQDNILRNIPEWWDWTEKHKILPCKKFLAVYKEHKKTVGFVVNEYKSGEMTGARFSRGLESKSLRPRSGRLITERLTQRGKTRIRRSIQCSDMDFVSFITFTVKANYSQKLAKNIIVHNFINPGLVRDQDAVKKKFKQMLNTIKVTYDRKAKKSGNEKDKIAYVWVAELQKNGNIHFHCLFNKRIPISWLTELWKEEKNSVDVKRIQNINHANCYLRKYITKEESQKINGNRYGISQNLRETMQPIRTEYQGIQKARGIQEIIGEMKDIIEENGGKVLDFGFYVPKPERSRRYKKFGKVQQTKPVSKFVAPGILEEINDMVAASPF